MFLLYSLSFMYFAWSEMLPNINLVGMKGKEHWTVPKQNNYRQCIGIGLLLSRVLIYNEKLCLFAIQSNHIFGAQVSGMGFESTNFWLRADSAVHWSTPKSLTNRQLRRQNGKSICHSFQWTAKLSQLMWSQNTYSQWIPSF